MILEGCYPYVRGGVSSWADDYIRTFSDFEFVLWTLGADSKARGVYKYELPPNVVEVKEVFLDEAFKHTSGQIAHARFTDRERHELAELINCGNPDWMTLFERFRTAGVKPVAFLQSAEFLKMVGKLCDTRYSHFSFTSLFHTVRSMFLPLLFIMTRDIPKADIYHSVATGYCGILGSMAKRIENKPLVLTEHGIYTREREEEILRSDWVISNLKDLWIQFFNMLSRCAYDHAEFVTSLFGHARVTQLRLGAQNEKTRVISNGIRAERFSSIPHKEEDGMIDIGAVVRIAPIKDIKTMIYAFSELKQSEPNAVLHILGDTDDEKYGDECHALVKYLGTRDVIFVGNTDVVEYMRKLDFTILTSISEGQPLAVLEAMASGRAVVSTDVGACRELLEGGEGDDLGICGYVCRPMDPISLAGAMKRMCLDANRRRKMGEIGRTRVRNFYTHSKMADMYLEIYEKLMG